MRGLVPLVAILPPIILDFEALSELDWLSVQFYVEYQEAIDIQEAIRCNLFAR